MTNKIDLSNRAPRKQFTAADIPGLFSSNPIVQPESILQIPLGALIPWDQQPFKPYSDEKLQQLTEDVKTNGVMNPIIVRPHGDRYQILAGHNRWNASRRAGLTTIPAIVKDVDDDAATLIMVNTNLNQRDQLLPSERAFAYRMQLEAMKRQGQRSDLTSSQNGTKLRSDEILAEQTGESRNQISRYIRLTYLIPELLEMVDKGMLGFIPAVTLSYLPETAQQLVCDVSAECDKKISTVQAEKLKQAAKSGLTEAAIRAILLPDKPWNAQSVFVSNTRRLIPDTATTEDIGEIVRLIEQYFTRGGDAIYRGVGI